MQQGRARIEGRLGEWGTLISRRMPPPHTHSHACTHTHMAGARLLLSDASDPLFCFDKILYKFLKLSKSLVPTFVKGSSGSWCLPVLAYKTSVDTRPFLSAGPQAGPLPSHSPSFQAQ